MRILITCEFSGQVSAAFRERGHTAYSCDLLPSERNPEWHICGDALRAIQTGCPPELHRNRAYFPNEPWDLIGIHYSCTYFTNSGVRWLYLPRTDGNLGMSSERDSARWGKMREAAAEFAAIWRAAVATGARVYFENPIMHHWAMMEIERQLGTWQLKPTQIIQPCNFGHPETKATGLWLHNLPPLRPTKIVRNEMALLPKKERTRVHFASPGKDRWKERSRTLPGIAAAMAEQWGPLI